MRLSAPLIYRKGGDCEVAIIRNSEVDREILRYRPE